MTSAIRLSQQSRLSQGSAGGLPRKIPAAELLPYRQSFDWCDREGRGRIQGIDLAMALRAAGQYWTYAELKLLQQEFPLNAKITYEEYLKVCRRKHGQRPDFSKLEDAFKAFDRAGTGKLLVEDLKHVVCSVGEKLSAKEFEELLTMRDFQYAGGRQTMAKGDFMRIFGEEALSSGRT